MDLHDLFAEKGTSQPLDRIQVVVDLVGAIHRKVKPRGFGQGA